MQKRFDSVLTGLLIDIGHCPVLAAPSLKRGEECAALLVGVSGGVDSMCLAHLLLHSSVQVKIIVAHCNFHLRGAESDGDEALIREFCAANGVEFCKADFDTLGYARKNGLSMEIAARELRYEWFGRLCGERGLDAVVVAHNANDNAETLFLNLLRGTGLRGLCGMRPVSVVPAGEALARERPNSASEAALELGELTPNNESAPEAKGCPEHLPLLRPLLEFNREQIEVYARASNIRWREDSTNAANDCHRNILRNEVFPLLSEINPSFIRTLNREMRFFTDANDLVEAVVPDLLRDGKIDIEELLSYGPWRIFLFNLLRPFNFPSAVIDDIAEHLMYDLENHIFLSPTHRLQITSKNLIISGRSKIESPDTHIYKEGIYKIEGGTIKEITDGVGEGRTINIEVIPRDSLTDLKAPRGTTYLDADKVRFPFIIRGWRHGDWFRPLGLGGATKKVSDLFVDLKYSASDKENALFLTLPRDSKSHICALLGERVDDSFKISPSTRRVLRVIIQ